MIFTLVDLPGPSLHRVRSVAAASKIRVVIQTASLRHGRREVLLLLGAASGTTYSCIPAGLVASCFMLLIRYLGTVLLAHTPYLKLACRTPSVGAGLLYSLLGHTSSCFMHLGRASCGTSRTGGGICTTPVYKQAATSLIASSTTPSIQIIAVTDTAFTLPFPAAHRYIHRFQARGICPAGIYL
jgi:hypothetical protein